MSFKQELIKMDVCKKAIEWVGDRTLKQAWDECLRGDWMLWLLEKMEGKEEWLDEKEIMLLGCWCARRALKYIPKEKTRALKAIEAKEKWVRGEITREEMNAARNTTLYTWESPSAAASYVAWGAASVIINTAASATMNGAETNVYWFSTRDTTLKDPPLYILWDAARDKESKIQADYVRAQFTPPV